jgi:hypothetical protein
MLISLQEAAAFLHAHHAVFDELWRRRDEPLCDADLIVVIASTRTEVTPAYLLAQLKRMRFIVGSDEAGVWQIAPPFFRWVEYLQQTTRPVSSSVVRGYLAELEHLLESFRLAEAAGNTAEGRDILRDTRTSFQTLVEGLGQTRAAIAATVSETKAEHRTQSAVERFRRINRLWVEYLMPMLELLDPAGALEVVCVAWEHQLAQALEKQFLPERRMAERIESDMQFLRVAVRQSFRECRGELEPLHARLRRDTLWTQGAARILAEVERSGLAASPLAEALPVSTFRFSGHIAQAALEASAAVWIELNVPPLTIDFAGADVAVESQEVEDLLALIERLPAAYFPVCDLLDWLAREHGGRGFHVVLQVFSLLVTDARYQATFGQPIVEYPVAGGVVRCGRVNLELRKIA